MVTRCCKGENIGEMNISVFIVLAAEVYRGEVVFYGRVATIESMVFL